VQFYSSRKFVKLGSQEQFSSSRKRSKRTILIFLLKTEIRWTELRKHIVNVGTEKIETVSQYHWRTSP
jgi:hypothetical protein